jgi:hypothetical protein
VTDIVNQRSRERLEAGLHVEREFYEQAAVLRSEFESKLSAPTRPDSTSCFLSYTYCPNIFHCLTGDANQVFVHESLVKLLDRLRTWARQNLRTEHASTPAVRVYINGCGRSMIRDDATVKWHYLLCLTRPSKTKLASVRVVVDSLHETWRNSTTFGASRIVSVNLEFNQLLVHEIIRPYGLYIRGSSMDPADSAVFLDGYFW